MEALPIEASSFHLCQMACFFKARFNPQFNRGGNLIKEWLSLRNKLNYTHTKIGAKVHPHQPTVSIVFSTQKLKYLRFLKDCGVCGNNKESTSEQHMLVILMIKLLQKGHYYPSLLTVVHSFCMRVEISCEVNENELVLYSTLS